MTQREPEPGTREYWQEMWEQQLFWHRNSGGTVTLHSKHRQEPPEGFLRLGYAVKYPDQAQGPNYLYIKAQWVVELLPRRGTRPPHATWREEGKRGKSYTSMDDESYELLRKTWEAVRGPFQLRLAL